MRLFSGRLADRELAGNGDRVTAVLEDVLRRRAAGEQLPDSAIIAAHPNLMPKLGARLRALQDVEQAEQRARNPIESAGQPASTVMVDGQPADRLPTDAFPGYELIDEIHRGGQGIVYRAIQRSTKRKVAIKVLLEGAYASKAARRRFEREIELVAQLRHPNIISIFDSDTTASGRRFYVMDYVRGRTLREYVLENKLGLEETLHLFSTVCLAVQYAHQRGVIHRDLKPSNILIDADGRPKILDFGLAKWMAAPMETWVSVSDNIVGTLPYMSPEQASGSYARVDLRADVYALGIILYQVLVGRFPYTVTGNIREAIENIVQSEPVRPRSIRRDLDEDVQTIVLKCLAKEPERRYQSTGALAEDLARYMAHQPILARTPSTVYQIKKLVARHKLSSVLVMALLAIVPSLTIWMGVLYAHEGAERRRATLAEQRAEEHRAEAVLEARTVRAVNDFLINDMLGAADPLVARGEAMSVVEVLDNASGRIETAFTEQPRLRAAILNTLGQTYLTLGLYDKAEAHLRQAEHLRCREFGEGHALSNASRGALIAALLGQAKTAEAERLAERMFHSAREKLGEDDPWTLRTACQYATTLHHSGKDIEAVETLSDTLPRQRALTGDDHPNALACMSLWATLLLNQGRTAEAEHFARIAEEGLRRLYGPDAPATLGAMSFLGQILSSQQRLDEAEPLLRQAYEGDRYVYGDEHHSTLGAGMSLALLCRDQARIVEAERLYRELVEIARRVHGVDHPQTARLLESLGSALDRLGEYGEAIAAFQEALDINRRLYGGESAQTAQVLDGLSSVFYRIGRYAEAEDGHRRALAVKRRVLGDGHGNTAWSLRCLVRTLAAQDKFDDARPFMVRLLESRRRDAERPGADANQLGRYARELLMVEPADMRDPALALKFAALAAEKAGGRDPSTLYVLALAHHATGNLNAAIETARYSVLLTPLEASLERAVREARLVRFIEESGDLEAAEQVYRDTLLARREQFPEGHGDVGIALTNLGAALVRHEKFGEAEPLLRQCLETWEQFPPRGHWRIADATSWLGASLLGQGAFAEAESLLLQGYDLAANDPFSPRKTIEDAADRIVHLYESWDKQDSAEMWRKLPIRCRLPPYPTGASGW